LGRSRQLEYSTDLLSPGYTVSTYRDAYCAPHLDESATLSVQGAGATRALVGSPLNDNQVTRAPNLSVAPRVLAFVATPPGADRDATGGGATFYGYTTYRDSFGNPFECPSGPLNDLSPETIGETGKRSRDGNGNRAAAKAVADAARSRTANAPVRRSFGWARTTYREAFGFPEEIPPGPPTTSTVVGAPLSRNLTRGKTEARATTVAAARSLKLNATKDPRWPSGAVT
jgi:hypothetical protein